MGKKRRKLFSPKFAAWRARRDELRANKASQPDPPEEKVEEKVEEVVSEKEGEKAEEAPKKKEVSKSSARKQAPNALKKTNTRRKK